MKKTMLTYKTLDRFEAEYKTEHYTKAQIEAIEMAAYIANMNQSAHRDWTEEDIFADFLRVLDIDHIKTAPMRTAAEPEKAAEAPEAPAAVPMFPNLCEALSEEADRRRAENRFFIENGFFPSWAKEHQTDPERGLKQYSTPKKWEAYQAGTLSREKAVEIAVKRAEKEIDKWHEKQLAKLRTAAGAVSLGFVSISVEWSKNRTWGANPTATVRTSDGVFSGHASGCGYDKESAAVAEALNQSPAVMRMLYTAAENAMKSGKAPAETGNASCVSWRDILGYGSGYSLLPYFERGVGVSCFWSIFKVCGYDCRSAGSGKTFDACAVERAV